MKNVRKGWVRIFLMLSKSRIEQFPEAAPVVGKGIRKRLISGFPFTILYQRDGDMVFIADVMHQHRKPGYWKARLRSR